MLERKKKPRLLAEVTQAMRQPEAAPPAGGLAAGVVRFWVGQPPFPG